MQCVLHTGQHKTKDMQFSITVERQETVGNSGLVAAAEQY